MADDPEQTWTRTLREAAQALGREVGARVDISDAAPVTEGWSARHADYSWIRRCRVSGLLGSPSTSVIVKTPRPSRESNGAAAIRRERAALALLSELGSNQGPRVLAHGEAFLVLEDLGRGPAVEDRLVEDDPVAATKALVALARAVGAMQATTYGHQDAFYERLELSGTRPREDRLIFAGSTMARCWAVLGDLAAGGAGLPATSGADTDFEELTARLAEPGPLLALSTGDLAPQNCRLLDGAVRLLDFESACYRHVMLDAAHFRLPFCGAPCWARVPADVGEAMEAAFRSELGRVCVAVLDERTYRTGMALATAAWAVIRLARLPKLLARDKPHPMGFSRRGQLVDTLQSAIDAARVAGTLGSLRTWFEQAVAALRRVWPEVPAAQEVYPALRERALSRGAATPSTSDRR